MNKDVNTVKVSGRYLGSVYTQGVHILDLMVKNHRVEIRLENLLLLPSFSSDESDTYVTLVGFIDHCGQVHYTKYDINFKKSWKKLMYE